MKKSSRPSVGKLIQRQQQAMVLRTAGAVAVQIFHQRPACLIDHQPDQRAQTGCIRWWRLEVKRHGPVGAHQIAQPKIAGGGIAGNDVVRPKREICRRRSAHAGLELRRLAAQLVGHQRHFRVNLRRTGLRVEAVRRADHRQGRPLEVEQPRPHRRQILILVRLGVEHMQDQRHQKLARLLVPNVHRVLCAGWVHQHLDDVLRIAHFVGALANLKERIEPGAVRPGRIEEQAVASFGAHARRHVPQFVLDVVGQDAAVPVQQRGNDVADAFAGSAGPGNKLVFGAVVGEILTKGMSENGSLAGQ